MTDFGPVFELAKRNEFKDRGAKKTQNAVRMLTSLFNYANPAVWNAIALNYVGTEVDPTNVQEIENNLQIAQKTLSQTWVKCVKCKWNREYVHIEVKDIDINSAVANASATRAYETGNPEMNFMLYMANELQLIKMEFLMLSGIVFGHTKEGITQKLKEMWNRGAKNFAKDTANSISNVFARIRTKEIRDDTVDVSSLKIVLVDIVERGKTIRDIVYDFTIMTRNYLNVLNTQLVAFDCRCCPEACNTKGNACATAQVCKNGD